MGARVLRDGRAERPPPVPYWIVTVRKRRLPTFNS